MRRRPSRAPRKGSRKYRQPQPQRADALRPLLSWAAVLPVTRRVEPKAWSLGPSTTSACPASSRPFARLIPSKHWVPRHSVFISGDSDLDQPPFSRHVTERPSQSHPWQESSLPGAPCSPLLPPRCTSNPLAQLSSHLNASLFPLPYPCQVPSFPCCRLSEELFTTINHNTTP